VLSEENTGSNQWRSSGEVIDWFQDLPDKDKLTFFKFDIVSFYPSITKKLLTDAIQWAEKEKHYKFDQKQMDIIFHAKRFLLIFFWQTMG